MAINGSQCLTKLPNDGGARLGSRCSCQDVNEDFKRPKSLKNPRTTKLFI